MNAPVSNALIDLLRQTRVVAALRAFMPEAQVLFDAEDTRPYECDGLSAYRQVPKSLQEEIINKRKADKEAKLAKK